MAEDKKPLDEEQLDQIAGGISKTNTETAEANNLSLGCKELSPTEIEVTRRYT